MKAEEAAGGSSRNHGSAEPARNQPEQPDVEQVEGLDHGDIDRELQPGHLFHRVEVIVAHGTKVVGLELRSDSALEEIDGR